MNIHIKKGLDLPLDGVAKKQRIDLRTSVSCIAVKPTDVLGFTPRLLVAVGDEVCAGQRLLVDKHDERIALTSPVDGIVKSIVRGEKRRLEAVIVERDIAQKNTSEVINHTNLSTDSPCWWMIKERPFGCIANPDHHPKGIFISLLDTNPLAPDMQYVMQGRENDFAMGLHVLAEKAPVHLCIPHGYPPPTTDSAIHIHTVEGPHPAGNIGTQVAHISPINKGEYVWTVGAQDVATIGHWIATGEYRPERIVSVGGPSARSPHYYQLIVGSQLSLICDAQLINNGYPALSPSSTNTTRIISGSVLNGTTVASNGFLGMYDQQITLIEEGDHYEFMGWLMPGLKKFSFSKTFLSGFTGLINKMSVPALFGNIMPRYTFNTNLHGSVRPFLFTGQFERIFPFDIYPLQLIKACIVGDIELQEKLGIYEVEPEDFALCEFIDPSKTEIQSIIREALEVLRKETI